MDLNSLDADPVSTTDPNVLLSQLRGLANEILADLDNPETAEDVSAGEAGMATLFLQLDDWMSRRGFPPGAWQDTPE
jgi:hypothetical protein